MSNGWHARKLLTVIAEAALERALVEAARAAGAGGYTVSDVRGGGRAGERSGEWEGERSIEFRVVCDDAIAEHLADRIMREYADNYSLVLYVSEVGVRRGQRFP
ncbi:MAG: P-II family nitrogen regulator [Burkholderiales bacterium]